MEEYFARGKLLLSAEYLVMYGAEALALPLVRGQRLTVSRQRTSLSPRTKTGGTRCPERPLRGDE